MNTFHATRHRCAHKTTRLMTNTQATPPTMIAANDDYSQWRALRRPAASHRRRRRTASVSGGGGGGGGGGVVMQSSAATAAYVAATSLAAQAAAMAADAAATSTQRTSQSLRPTSLSSGQLQASTTMIMPIESHYASSSSRKTDMHRLQDVREYVTQVRELVGLYWPLFIIIGVIIIYLIFYMLRVCKRPRLIGNKQSKFVQFIDDNLRSILSRRFDVLIYFWGTNPQTALFGYLQGYTTVDEDMSAAAFKRQHLYVSDAQYLTSNVDLSAHYKPQQSIKSARKQIHKRRSKRIVGKKSLRAQDHRQQQQQQQQRPVYPVRLERDSCADTHSSGLSQFEQNIRSALSNFVTHDKEGQQQQKEQQRQQPSDRLSSASGSDSGVFGASSVRSLTLTSSSSSSSTKSSGSSSSSLSDVAAASSADSPNSKDGRDKYDECSCGQRRYASCETHEAPLVRQHKHSVSSTSSVPYDDSRPREEFEFGQCALDWHRASHANYHQNKLVALISAGMTTGSDKQYVTDTVKTLAALGYEVCVFIRRGCGGLKLHSSKFFSPAKWRDFEAAVLSVRRQRPNARLVAVGFSFGSLELCRYLAMSGRRSLVDAALLISCPFDPEAGGRNMRRKPLNRKIDAYLAKSLGKQLYAAALDGFCSSDGASSAAVAVANSSETAQQDGKAASAPTTNCVLTNYNGSLVNLASLPKLKSLVEFEDNYNRLIQNYPNSAAYAVDSRLHEHLHLISTPTLCVSSEDDFMAPLRLLPLDEIRRNQHLCMVLTKRGGHMGFIDGLWWPRRPLFAQRIIAAYFGAVRRSIDSYGDQPQHSTVIQIKSQQLFAKPAGGSHVDDLISNKNTQHALTKAAAAAAIDDQ